MQDPIYCKWKLGSTGHLILIFFIVVFENRFFVVVVYRLYRRRQRMSSFVFLDRLSSA